MSVMYDQQPNSSAECCTGVKRLGTAVYCIAVNHEVSLIRLHVLHHLDSYDTSTLPSAVTLN